MGGVAQKWHGATLTYLITLTRAGIGPRGAMGSLMGGVAQIWHGKAHSEHMLSAVHPIADSSRTLSHVRFVPKADSCTAAEMIVIRSLRRRGRSMAVAR
jgi:hypothetical protein